MSDQDSYDLNSVFEKKFIPVERGQSSGLAIQCKDDIVITLAGETGISILVKDQDGIFKYIGDISFHRKENNDIEVMVFSSGIKEIRTRKQNIIDNSFNALSGIRIMLNFEQQKKWRKKQGI